MICVPSIPAPTLVAAVELEHLSGLGLWRELSGTAKVFKEGIQGSVGAWVRPTSDSAGDKEDSREQHRGNPNKKRRSKR